MLAAVKKILPSFLRRTSTPLPVATAGTREAEILRTALEKIQTGDYKRPLRLSEVVQDAARWSEQGRVRAALDGAERVICPYLTEDSVHMSGLSPLDLRARCMERDELLTDLARAIASFETSAES